MFRSLLLLCGLALSAPLAAQNIEPCGEIDAGAKDYRLLTPEARLHVEGAHFTPEVEQLKRGKTGEVAGDIDYTLRHMPNHPRALMALMKLGQRKQRERLYGLRYALGCYFVRAVRFAPDDGQVRLVFGLYLIGQKDLQAARRELEAAATLAGESWNLHYNLGLAYLLLGDVEAARHHAERAYSLGHPPPGLAERLKKLGKGAG